MTKFQTDGFKVYLAVLLFYEAKVNSFSKCSYQKIIGGRRGEGEANELTWQKWKSWVFHVEVKPQWFKGDDAPFFFILAPPPTLVLSKYSLNEDTRALYVKGQTGVKGNVLGVWGEMRKCIVSNVNKLQFSHKICRS